MIQITWAEIKAIIDAGAAYTYYEDPQLNVIINLQDGNIIYQAVVSGADLTDFNDNYLLGASSKTSNTSQQRIQDLISSNLVDANRLKVDVTGTLTDGKVKATDQDSTTGFLQEKIVSANNKISISVLDAGNDEDLQLQLNPANIGTNELNNDANFITAAQAPVQSSDISDFETSSELNARDVINRNRTNHTGTQIASTISDFSSAVVAAETTTTLDFNNTTKSINIYK